MDKVPAVRDVMVEANFSLDPDMSAYEALDILVSRRSAGIPVIDHAGKLVGFFTEKDCLRLLAVAHLSNVTGTRVRDAMSEIKAALHPDMDILTATMHFLNCNFATLPVIDGDRLVGCVSRQNMLQGLQNLYRERGLHKEHSKKSVKIVENPSSIADLQELVARSNNAQLASVLAGRLTADQ